MNDNPKILKCKILHLKAIELVARFMPNSNLYVSHLISSFNKNYKFYMDKIVSYMFNVGVIVIFDSREPKLFAEGSRKVKASSEEKRK